MFGLLTKHQNKMVREAAPRIAANERELAKLKLQREEIQKTLSDLLTLKEPVKNGDD